MSNLQLKTKNLIFGVEIGTESKVEIINIVENALISSQKLFVVTLNPEILLKAADDEEYRNILNKADLKIVDGFGVKLVSLIKGFQIGKRMAGADLAQDIVEKAKKCNLKMAYVILKDGWSTKQDVEGITNYELRIMSDRIVEVNQNFSGEELLKVPGDTEILLVGLGAPFQEKFIYETKDELPNLKIAIGVGGTFDYWTGKRKRAPKILQKFGLEWLWRLTIQPNRFMRIFNATAVFLYRTLIKQK